MIDNIEDNIETAYSDVKKVLCPPISFPSPSLSLLLSYLLFFFFFFFFFFSFSQGVEELEEAKSIQESGKARICGIACIIFCIIALIVCGIVIWLRN